MVLHAWLCDVGRAEPIVRRHLLESGVNIFFKSRIIDVEMEKNKIKSVMLSVKDTYFRVQNTLRE